MINLKTASEQEIVKMVPELLELKKIVENSHESHKNDPVYNHTMNVFLSLKNNFNFDFVDKPDFLAKYFNSRVGRLDRYQCLLWSALLHDIAKPDVIVRKGEFSSCLGHEERGAIKTEQLLKKIIVNEADVQIIAKIVRWHEKIKIKMIEGKMETLKKIGFVKEEFSDIFIELLFLRLSDAEGSQLKVSNPAEFKFRVDIYHQLINKLNL